MLLSYIRLLSHYLGYCVLFLEPHFKKDSCNWIMPTREYNGNYDDKGSGNNFINCAK